jgi:carbamoyl-phosphate synthase large subunit
VAPAQTLTDKEYQRMRDAAIAIIREIGVETGGSNIQFAINPDDGRMVAIEMNPRVSRSSALASKATGFPIAKIAAKLAVGYRLDELKNDITRETPACFEPTIDYVVTKIPRWTFEKFPDADATLTTQMKSVGETMAIGRTFKESLQKALRGLETGRFGLGCDRIDRWGTPQQPATDEVLAKLATPNHERVWFIRYAFKLGLSPEDIYQRTKIDPWFLDNIREIVEMEDRLRACPNLESADDELIRAAKQFGFADRQLAHLWHSTEAEVRRTRKEKGIQAVFKLVDTCAAEFEAYTPYYYSTYESPSRSVDNRGSTPLCHSERSEESLQPAAETLRCAQGDKGGAILDPQSSIFDDETRPPSGKDRIMILGGGPNRIGQGIEFDYCCCQAAFALKEAGYETIMVNSNPETVSTDYDTSDHLFFEPLTTEDVLNICDRMQPKGLIVQFGGQTPLNLAKALEAAGAPIIGTSVDSIDIAEDRERFQELVDRLGLKQPANGIALDLPQALHVARRIGYPVLVRPSYVLGGRAMEIVYDDAGLSQYMKRAMEASPDKPILIDKFLEAAIEVDVDCLSDGEQTLIGGVMQHIEEAGVHSGDSACVIPPHSLSKEVVEEIKRQTRELARELRVKGLMNVQFAVTGAGGTSGQWAVSSGQRRKEENSGQSRDGLAGNSPSTVQESGLQPAGSSSLPTAHGPLPTVYVLEVNPRASRTVPFVSKATSVPLARLAALVMVGQTLEHLSAASSRPLQEVIPRHFSVKESVFPFNKFPGVDIILGPEMRSTGEVMGIDDNFPMAFAKSQMAANSALPLSGRIFISVADRDKTEVVSIARALVEMGYQVISTRGTGAALRAAGIDVAEIAKIQEGRPNLVDYMKNGQVVLIINTPSGKGARTDEGKIRAAAVAHGVTCITTLAAAHAAVEACRALREQEVTVSALQDRFTQR